MGFKMISIATIILIASGNVFGTTISTEDFNSGATGWTNNTTTSIGGNWILGGYNVFGAGVQTAKSFAISAGESQIDIEFDFYRIDSWDSERFILDINGTNFIDDIYTMSGGASNITGGPFSDEIVHYSLSFALNSSNLDMIFSSTLNQAPTDESWGIDNLVITQTMSAVPVPAAIWLFGSGLIGLIGVARGKKA